MTCENIISGAGSTPQTTPSFRAKNEFLEWVQAIIFALALAFFIRTFIVQAFKIPSASMEPTLLVGDHIMANKFIYGAHLPFTDIHLWRLSEPERGDIVIFLMPRDVQRKAEYELLATRAKAENDQVEYDRNRRLASETEIRDFVKRVIGLPGDTIEVRGATVFINGEPLLDDPGVWDNNYNSRRRDFGPVTVPPDSYFCMGDNRDNSEDSRIWGFVPFINIKAKAFVIYWSWNDNGGGLRWDRIMSVVE